jgi:hypothetical protein
MLYQQETPAVATAAAATDAPAVGEEGAGKWGGFNSPR